MSLYRVTLVAVATLFSIGMTSLASACCNWGYSNPVAYTAAAPGGYGCCGGQMAAAVYAQPLAPAPIVAANNVTPFGGPCCGWSGCGNCGGWSGGCSSCGGGCGGGCGLFGGGVGWGGGGWGGGGCCGGSWGGGCCARTVGYALMPAPYVVNQGPTYSGPGLMQPYATYSPDTAYAPASDYPYVPGYGYGPAPVSPPYYSHLYYRPHYAVRAPVYGRPVAPGPHYYYGAPQWHHYS
jgi:hypothetical protein